LISGGLSIWGNILHWANSIWMAVGVVLLIGTFFAARRFSAVETAKKGAGWLKDEFNERFPKGGGTGA
jgi:hypothetical protein